MCFKVYFRKNGKKYKIVCEINKKLCNAKRTTHASNISRSCVTSGLTTYPTLLANGTSMFTTCVINAFLAGACLHTDPDNVSASIPNKHAMISLMNDDAVRVLALKRKWTHSEKKFYCAGTNKGIDVVAKMIS